MYISKKISLIFVLIYGIMKDQTVRNFRHEESALRDKLIKSVGFVLFCVHLEERQLRSWGG